MPTSPSFETNARLQAPVTRCWNIACSIAKPSFDFVTRLMEQFGLYYYFKHDREQHKLVIADDPNAHDTLPEAIPFVFDQTEFRIVADHIWEWSTELALHVGQIHLPGLQLHHAFGRPDREVDQDRHPSAQRLRGL